MFLRHLNRKLRTVVARAFASACGLTEERKRSQGKAVRLPCESVAAIQKTASISVLKNNAQFDALERAHLFHLLDYRFRHHTVAGGIEMNRIGFVFRLSQKIS